VYIAFGGLGALVRGGTGHPELAPVCPVAAGRRRIVDSVARGGSDVAFGTAYEAYATQTGRFIPKVWGRQQTFGGQLRA